MEKRKKTQDTDLSKRRKVDSSQIEISFQPRFNWEVQSGRIIRVRMKNFMNHAEYDYRPTEKLNFLNGSNGSGKSAVLTAIVFGLGGTARMSNRGASNNGLIRLGQNQTTVEITLHNCGDNSYKPEIYGDSITVVRSVNHSGGSSYRLKDERGRIARDKKVKEELDRILSCYGIQVDNPIAILNQDQAKTFLFKCEPPKLYDFFMKATQLDDCRNDYNCAYNEMKTAQGLIKVKEDSKNAIIQEVKKLEEKRQFFNKMDKKREDMDNLRAELGWSMVKQVRKEISNRGEIANTNEQKIVKCQQIIEETMEQQRNLKIEKSEIEKKLQETTGDNVREEESLDEYRQAARKTQLSVRNVAKTVSDLERKKKAKTDDVDALKSAIAKIRTGATEQELELASEKRKAELTKLEATKAEMEAQVSSRQNHMTNLQASLDACRESEYETKAKQTEAKSLVDRKVREIKGMQSRTDNKLFVFGEKMPNFVDMIQKNIGRFKVPPIGPLGFHIELQRDVTQEEAKIIENELGSHLKTFLVANFDDSRMLQALSTKCNIQISVVTTTFSAQVYDVSGRKCLSNKFKTILDRLLIKDPNVTNYLIDVKRIENVLIIPDDAEAFGLLSTMQTVPQNCKYALTYNFGQVYPAPNCRTYSVNPGKFSNTVLQTSVGQLLEKFKSDLQEHKQALAEAEKDLKECWNKKKEHEKEFFQAENSLKELRKKIVNIGSNIALIRSKESASKPPDISALEEDLEKTEEVIAEIQEKLEKLKEQFREAKEEYERIAKVISDKEAEIQDKARNGDLLAEKMTSIEKALAKNLKNREHHHNKIKEYKKKKEEAESIVLKQTAKLENQIKLAQQWSLVEVETDRKPEEISREINVLKESLLRLEGTTESREEVMEKYQKLSVLQRKLETEVNVYIDTIKRLERMLKLRKTGFLKIRSMVCRRIQIGFTVRLCARKFIGELDFSHENKTLTINVCPEGGVIRQRDLKGLSGGEKSYSTISLILAMWDCIQPPFRCLDEFDVFMDSVNRRVAIDQIVNYAKESRNYQYIFLTPLSIDSVAGDEDIQIVQIQKNDG